MSCHRMRCLGRTASSSRGLEARRGPRRKRGLVERREACGCIAEASEAVRFAAASQRRPRVSRCAPVLRRVIFGTARVARATSQGLPCLAATRCTPSPRRDGTRPRAPPQRHLLERNRGRRAGGGRRPARPQTVRGRHAPLGLVWTLLDLRRGAVGAAEETTKAGLVLRIYPTRTPSPRPRRRRRGEDTTSKKRETQLERNYQSPYR